VHYFLPILQSENGLIVIAMQGAPIRMAEEENFLSSY
jgi:hypothetical protein